MTGDFKIFPIMLLRKLNFGTLKFNSCFTFVAKEKLCFSLIFTFNCFFVKEGFAQKVA